MNDVTILHFGKDELLSFSSLIWNQLDEDIHPRRAVTRFSINTGSIRGLLVVERCHLEIPAISALVRLGINYARKGGVSISKEMPDIGTSLGVFVRRIFVLKTGSPRTVIAAASEVQGEERDVFMQFVIPSVIDMDDELDHLSLMAIAKVLAMSE